MQGIPLIQKSNQHLHLFPLAQGFLLSKKRLSLHDPRKVLQFRTNIFLAVWFLFFFPAIVDFLWNVIVLVWTETLEEVCKREDGSRFKWVRDSLVGFLVLSDSLAFIFELLVKFEEFMDGLARVVFVVDKALGYQVLDVRF